MEVIALKNLRHDAIEGDRELLFNFPSNNEGINTRAAVNFVVDLGLMPMPFKLLTPDNAHVLSQKVRIPELKRFLMDDSSGIVISPLNFALVKRSLEDENLNGPTITEATLVEELLHSTTAFSKFAVYSSATNRVASFRQGFVRREEQQDGKPGLVGFGLEEGYAAMHAASYVKANRHPDADSNIRSIYGSQITEETTVPFIYSKNGRLQLGYPIPMPIKYGFLGEHAGRLTFNFRWNAFVGYGMELLCKLNPDLNVALHHSRENVEGLREVSKELTRIDKKLYMYMLKAPYSVDGFVTRLDYILNLVTNNNPLTLVNTPLELGNFWEKNILVAKGAVT